MQCRVSRKLLLRKNEAIDAMVLNCSVISRRAPSLALHANVYHGHSPLIDCSSLAPDEGLHGNSHNSQSSRRAKIQSLHSKIFHQGEPNRCGLSFQKSLFKASSSLGTHDVEVCTALARPHVHQSPKAAPRTWRAKFADPTLADTDECRGRPKFTNSTIWRGH